MTGVLATLGGFQQSLSQLKCSTLMNSEEYLDMYHVLNNYFGIHELNSDSLFELEGNEQPFLYTLVQQLLKVNEEDNPKNRSESLDRVYQWYCANKRVIDAKQEFSSVNADKRTCSAPNINLYVYPRTSPTSLLTTSIGQKHFSKKSHTRCSDGTKLKSMIDKQSLMRQNKKNPLPNITHLHHPKNKSKLKYLMQTNSCTSNNTPEGSPVIKPTIKPTAIECPKKVLDNNDELLSQPCIDDSGQCDGETFDEGDKTSEVGPHADDGGIRKVNITYPNFPKTFNDQEDLVTKYMSLNLDIDVTPVIDVDIRQMPHQNGRNNTTVYENECVNVTETFTNGKSSQGRKSQSRKVLPPNRKKRSISASNAQFCKTQRHNLDNRQNQNCSQQYTYSYGFIGKDVKKQKWKSSSFTRKPWRSINNFEGFEGRDLEPVIMVKHIETKKQPAMYGSPNGKKSEWVMNDSVFPSDKGYINFSKSLESKGTSPEPEQPLESRFMGLAFPVNKKFQKILEKSKLGEIKGTKPGPPMKTHGKNISLKPRPPLNAFVTDQPASGSSSEEIQNIACSCENNSSDSKTSDDRHNSAEVILDEDSKEKKIVDCMSTGGQDVPSKLVVNTNHKKVSFLDQDNEVDLKKILTIDDGTHLKKHNQETIQRNVKIHPRNSKDSKRKSASKDEMNKAAVKIQKIVRGWLVRKQFETCKSKIGKRSLNFQGFVHNKYIAHLEEIMKRHGNENPKISLQFNELFHYVDKVNKYEVAFDRTAKDRNLPFNDIKSYLATCGLFPSKQEIIMALGNICDYQDLEASTYIKDEIVKMTFEIYVPKGTHIKEEDIRKSTWMNPLISGEEAIKLLGKKGMEETNLGVCMAVVQERMYAQKVSASAEEMLSKDR